MARKGTSTEIEQFKNIVSLTKELIDRELIKVRLSLPAQVDLEFKPKQLKSTLAMHSIDIDDFRRVLTVEISRMMEAILSKTRKVFVSFTLDRMRESAEESEFNEEQERKNLEDKLDTVEKTLITDLLRRELAIKSTSKTNVFHKASWEINEKHFDESGAQPEHLFYVTLRLDLQKTPVSERLIFPMRLFGPETVSTVFDASLEDIEELQETLSQIRRRLEELTKQRK